MEWFRIAPKWSKRRSWLVTTLSVWIKGSGRIFDSDDEEVLQILRQDFDVKRADYSGEASRVRNTHCSFKSATTTNCNMLNAFDQSQDSKY